MQKFINTGVREGGFSSEEIASLLDMLQTLNEVLGIMNFALWDEDEAPEEIQHKLEQRKQAKENKDFDMADRLRQEIEDAGYTVIDDRSGSRVEKR